MKKIIDFVQYEGGIVHPHVLYITGSEDIVVQGKVDFNVFGKVRCNGVLIDGKWSVTLEKPAVLSIQKDSALIFNRAPTVMVEHESYEPVPDVPDMEDAQTRQLHALFEDWAIQRGLVSRQAQADFEESAETDFPEDEMEDDFEDDFDHRLDTDSLVEEPENVIEFNNPEPEPQHDEARDAEPLEVSAKGDMEEEPEPPEASEHKI